MLRSSLLFILLAFSASASAQEFDYNWLSFGYGQTELDDIDVDGDGFGIGGSFAIADNFHVFGGYSQTSFDFDVDGTSFNAGLGYNTPLSNVVDFVATLSYEYVEVDAPGFSSVDDNGFGLGVGLRWWATPKIEVDAGIQYVDLSDSGDDTGLGLGGWYYFTPAFSLGLNASFTDDATGYSLAGRFFFGQ